MRNFEDEFKKRVDYIRSFVESAGASGIVYGNSGGKDSALVGILCKSACDNTLGIIMPCGSSRNYSLDAADARIIAGQYEIETRTVDLSGVRTQELDVLNGVCKLNDAARINIAPRLRMITLYAIAAAENRVVAGTGNRSEAYMGYFTKWGDGAHDFNPIADLTVTEIYAFLAWLGAPQFLQEKAPSAGLFDTQTDESEMGVTYAAIDRWILEGSALPEDKMIIDRFHSRSEHKRRPISTFDQP
jgi:NAD+ synthase